MKNASMFKKKSIKISNKKPDKIVRGYTALKLNYTQDCGNLNFIVIYDHSPETNFLNIRCEDTQISFLIFLSFLRKFPFLR